MQEFHEYKGAIHLHSTYSDGTKTIPEIIEIAKKCELDFMMFTDHMTLKPLEDGHAGWHERLLVVIGYEINDPASQNHYLAFGLDQTLPPDLPARKYVGQVKERAGLGILAHPDEVRNALAQFPPYPWTEWNLNAFDGIEIWNQMSEWLESLTKYNRFRRLLHPRKSLRGPTERILAYWDKQARKRKVLATGGVDAHGYRYRLGPFPLTIFPYAVQFKTLRTHLLLPEPFSGDFNTAKNQLLSALRECRVFISNLRWGETEGFSFTAENSEEMETIGGVIECKSSVRLKVSLPSKCQLRLIKNGITAVEEKTSRLEYVSYTPGIFRIEALQKGRGWIYSNHIYVVRPGEKKLWS